MMWEYFFPEEEQDSQRRQVSLMLLGPFVGMFAGFLLTFCSLSL